MCASLPSSAWAVQSQSQRFARPKRFRSKEIPSKECSGRFKPRRIFLWTGGRWNPTGSLGCETLLPLDGDSLGRCGRTEPDSRARRSSVLGTSQSAAKGRTGRAARGEPQNGRRARDPSRLRRAQPPTAPPARAQPPNAPGPAKDWFSPRNRLWKQT
eukprot:gene9891-biopygen13647